MLNKARTPVQSSKKMLLDTSHWLSSLKEGHMLFSICPFIIVMIFYNFDVKIFYFIFIWIPIFKMATGSLGGKHCSGEKSDKRYPIIESMSRTLHFLEIWKCLCLLIVHKSSS
ncbi:hypothetical protein KIL84_010471 [Mauremys mutica]|uniref:Uncharacterized protein n=1 Tax=Mauremys mutica TaxID=74926 RepID=A0A9D3X7K7_9SAUR|nr:hypothetical protein KIL84_010471 [Mauremys mutica]